MPMQGGIQIRLDRPIAAVKVVQQRPGAPETSQEQAQATSPAEPGVQAGLEALCSARSALEKAAGELRELQQRFLKEAEEQLLKLSVEIARKVLVQEIKAESYEVDPIVRQALGEIPRETDVVVYMNPNDLSRCELAGEGDRDASRQVRFVPDPAVKPAECRLETSQGTVESSVEGHLVEIASALRHQE